MLKSYKEFPETTKGLSIAIYPKKKQVCVNGFKYFNLKDLKKIPLNRRLSFSPKLFAAIDKA